MLEFDLITIIQVVTMLMSLGAFIVYIDQPKPNKLILAVLLIIAFLMFISVFGPEFQKMTEIVNT